MMKTQLFLTMLLFSFCQWTTVMSQSLVQKESNLCLNAKGSKKAQCLDLKKSPIAISYVEGAFRMFHVPGKPVGAPPKGIFERKQNTLIPIKNEISLKGNMLVIWNMEKKKIFEMTFIPGTRGVFQLERSGNVALYTEDCLELEPIEVRDGKVLYDGSEGLSSIYITLVERDDILKRLICKEGVGISCIEDNIIDPRFFSLDLNLEDAFGESFPVGFPGGGLDLPEGDGRWAAVAGGGEMCKDCEEVKETQWTKVCEIDLEKKGLYKDCDGHLLVIDLASGAVCMDVDLEVTAIKVASVEGNMVRLSLPANLISGEHGCCPAQ